MKMQDFLKVALVQSTLDYRLAWDSNSPDFPNISQAESDRTWTEIKKALEAIDGIEDDDDKPHILIIPEFGVSSTREQELKNLAKVLGCIVISGLDYKKDYKDGFIEVRNEAYVCIPYGWPHGEGITKGKQFHFGKVFMAPEEKLALEKHKINLLKFKPAQSVYILDLEDFGRVGLAICADFYDINRFLIYRGRIQHLILIAYNKDFNSFLHLAEAISRIVFCNVIVCNTGFYGGSLVFSPKQKSHERYIYRHEGANLYTMQIVNVPIESIYRAQTSKNLEFKSKPPGYQYYGTELNDQTSPTTKEIKI